MIPKPAWDPSSNRLLGLELLRFGSALSVLFWHYQHFFYVGDQPVGLVTEELPLYFLLRAFYRFGSHGVEVFWCISGFIFFWKYRTSVAEKTITLKKFFVLRFSRLYPLHFVTLLLVALLQAMYFARTGTYFVFQNNDLKHFVVQLFLANGWWYAEDYSFNGPVWSISREVPVYFFFFLTLRFVSRSAWVNIAILSAWLSATIARVSPALLDCLGFFYLGGLTAILAQSAERTRHRNVIRSIVLVAVVAVPVALYASSLYRHPDFLWIFMRTYVPTLLFVGAHPLIVGPFARKVIEAAGNMTYSSYLLHFPLQLSIVLIWGSIAPNSVGVFAAFMVATLASSYAVYRYFEKPAQDAIRGIV